MRKTVPAFKYIIKHLLIILLMVLATVGWCLRLFITDALQITYFMGQSPPGEGNSNSAGQEIRLLWKSRAQRRV